MSWQRAIGLAASCFVLGVIAQAALAQRRRPGFSPDLFQGKDEMTAAAALLDGALQLGGGRKLGADRRRPRLVPGRR